MIVIDRFGRQGVLTGGEQGLFDLPIFIAIVILLSGPVSVLCGGFLLLVTLVFRDRITWTRSLILLATLTPLILLVV